MGRTAPNITDAEWSVLEKLWDHGEATIRQLADWLYPKGGPSEYATVHKLLERLESKNFVVRKRNGGVFVFQPSIPRDEIIGRQLESLVDKMCGGSLQPLLTNLVRVKRLSTDELRDLLALVEELDARKRPRK